jgi:hypothetical protein
MVSARLLVLLSMLWPILWLAGACSSPSPSTSPAAEPAAVFTASPVPAETALPAPPASPALPTSSPIGSSRPTGAVASTTDNARAGRVRIANTEGQGANLRAEPSASAPRIKTLRDGAELEIVGPDRPADGRTWRNVRDPSDGASGWVAAEVLVAAPAEPTTAPDVARAVAPSPSPAAEAPPPAGPLRRVSEADRAYLTALQPEVDALGKAVAAASQQVEATGGRGAQFDDPSWRSGVERAADALGEPARRIRAARPGPNTGEVHERALKAADQADEAARLLTTALAARDSRGLATTRTALLGVIREINAMNTALIQLQS